MTIDEVNHARSIIDKHNRDTARVYICVCHELAGCGSVNSNGYDPHYDEYPIGTDPYKLYQIGQQISCNSYVKSIHVEDKNWTRNGNPYDVYYRVITVSKNPLIEEIRQVIREELNTKRHWWQ